MSYDPSLFVFVDLETTGLDPTRHQVWEVAVIVDELELVFQLPEPPGGWTVDLDALRVNRMADRYEGPSPTFEAALSAVRRRLDPLASNGFRGRHLVGANPKFDMEFLAAAFPAWTFHYRPVCVESMTLGRLGRYVKGLKGCAEALGVPYDEADAHTALHDVRAAKAIFDELMGGPG